MGCSGVTFNVQRFSTEDGPGIRTTVFMKGCPLRCAWCHNPEGLSARPELVWYDTRCIGARDCLAACPTGALALQPQGMHLARELCDACGTCVAVCPTGALEVIGRSWTVESLRAEVEKDTLFYETSGGGVTVSGGEPMAQAAFVTELCRQCHAAGLHVALDTCGAVPWAHYQAVLPFVDLVLYDLKVYDAARHRAATGVDNAGILDNARRLAAAGIKMWIRTPLIPGFTAGQDNVAALAAFIARDLPGVERWDLLAYTNLAEQKYARLDREYRLAGTPLLTGEEIERLHAVAVREVPVAVWSGATRQG